MKKVMIAVIVVALLLGLVALAWGVRVVPGSDKTAVTATESPKKPGPPPLPPGVNKENTTTSVAAALTPPPAQLLARADQMFKVTPEQLEKLKAIATKYTQDIQPLRKAAIDANAKLRTALLADNYEANEVATMVAIAQKAEAAISARELEVWHQIRAILTAEQVKVLRNGMAAFPVGGQGSTMMRPTAPPGPPSEWPKPIME